MALTREKVTVPLRWSDGGPEIGKAIVDWDAGTVEMQVLDPLVQELMGDPKNQGLFSSSVYTHLEEVKEVRIFAVAGIPKPVESENEMSDTTNQFPTSSDGDTPVDPSLASESSDEATSSSTNPATTDTDGTSTPTDEEASSDELGADIPEDDGSVGPGNPTDEGVTPSDTSSTPTDIPTSTDLGDETQNISSTGADASELGQDPASTTSDGASETPTSSGTDASESTSGAAGVSTEESSTSQSTTPSMDQSSTPTSGLTIQDVPGSAPASTPTDDGSDTLGDPELPVAPTPQQPIWPTADALPDGVEASQVEVRSLLTKMAIESRFGFHKAAIEGPDATSETHSALRKEFKDFATWLNDGIPGSREAALMFTALEEASMWAHKAIAKSDPLVEE